MHVKYIVTYIGDDHYRCRRSWFVFVVMRIRRGQIGSARLGWLDREERGRAEGGGRLVG
jgi:hypothetical protein